MSTDGEGIKWRRIIAKNFKWLSRVHERYRQTDGRATASEFTYAKNDVVVKLTYSLSLLLYCAKISSFHCQPETSAGCQLGLEATTLCTSIFYIQPGS